MPASRAFIKGLLDLVEEHVPDNQKKVFIKGICELPAGNQSVAITQQRLELAANERWGK